MDPIRTLIHAKLLDGRLSRNRVVHIRGTSGSGEMCDACDKAITSDEWVVTGRTFYEDLRESIQLHLGCFTVWDEVRLTT